MQKMHNTMCRVKRNISENCCQDIIADLYFFTCSDFLQNPYSTDVFKINILYDFKYSTTLSYKIMRKAIYPMVFVLSMVLTSCSSMMNNLPGVYTIDIQQGNIVNQEMIDQLRPQMTKRQILYIMGSPMLVDVFHQKRWDYLYSVQPGGKHRRQKRLSLFFDGDKLISMQGNFKPSTLPGIRQSNETTVEVPKRDLDKTLWDEIKKLLDDAAIKPQEEATKEEITDNPSKPDNKTIESVKKTDVNEEIELTPSEEEVPQELEEISDQFDPTQSNISDPLYYCSSNALVSMERV